MNIQTIKYLELPTSFNSKKPMSVQLRDERLKLFHKKKEIVTVTTKHPLILEACKYLQKTFIDIISMKATRSTGRNYDLFAIVYYLRTRNICTLDHLIQYVFTGRNIQNYKRHISRIEAQAKYINLFNYLDSLQWH